MLEYTYFFIILLSLILLLRDQWAISLRQVFYLFCILFFGIAGWVQYKYQFVLSPMYGELKEEDYLVANVLILINILVYEITYNYFKGNNKTNRETDQKTYIKAKHFPLIVVSSTVSVIFLYLNSFSLTNIFLRGGDGTRIKLNQTVSLLLTSIHYGIMAFAFFYYNSKNKNKYLSLLLMMLFVLFCFPTSIPRLKILPLYLPIVMLLIPALSKIRLAMSLMIFGGTIILFPLSWATRLTIDFAKDYYSNYTYSFSRTFSTLDFDTYKSFAYVVSKGLVTYGWQLLGCLLFWVPRSVWPTKPIGSGAVIATKYDLGIHDFTNISMNFFGEGFINFGFFGVILFAILLAYASAKFDSYFWIKKEGDVHDPMSIFYFSTIGFTFFVLRGDLLSGTAFYSGSVAYMYFVRSTCFQTCYNDLIEHSSVKISESNESLNYIEI